MGMKAQSELQVVATGKRCICPTMYWRIRDASSELTEPFPVTSQASRCMLLRLRCPTMNWRMYEASSELIPERKSPFFCGSTATSTCGKPEKAYAPVLLDVVLLCTPPLRFTVAPGTARSAL